MSKRNAQQFLAAVKADSELQAALASSVCPEDVVKLGRVLGFVFTVDEICAVRAELDREARGRLVGRKVSHNVKDGIVVHRVSYIPSHLQLARPPHSLSGRPS